jgi:hypothetical protein
MPTGYSQDVLTRIVNVQWASGLAVIFGKEDTDAPPFKPPPKRIVDQEDT